MDRSKRMARTLAAFGIAALALGGAASATSWTNVTLVDVNCSKKVKDDPDAHTRACALRCADSGYGIWTADGAYLKFDAAGSAKAKALLEASDQKDHLRVDVTGAVEGETLTVETIALTPAAQP